MQKYENKADDIQVCKKLLSEFLDFLKFKVDNDKLTLSEMRSLFAAFASNVSLTGTAEDIACFYGKSPQDVRNIVHRNIVDKPQRKVLYSFNEIQDVVPSKWHR